MKSKAAVTIVYFVQQQNTKQSIWKAAQDPTSRVGPTGHMGLVPLLLQEEERKSQITRPLPKKCLHIQENVESDYLPPAADPDPARQEAHYILLLPPISTCNQFAALRAPAPSQAVLHAN